MSKLFSINQIYCNTLPTSPIFFQSDLPSSHCPPWDSTHQDKSGWERGTSVHQSLAQCCSPVCWPGELSVFHGPAAVLLGTQTGTHTHPLLPPAMTRCLTLISSSAITLLILGRWAFEKENISEISYWETQHSNMFSVSGWIWGYSGTWFLNILYCSTVSTQAIWD